MSSSTEEEYFTFVQYLSLFKRHREKLMTRPEVNGLDNYGLGAYTAFDLSYSLLPQTAKDFLHISGFLHANISLAVLECAAKKNFSDWQEYIARPETHGEVKEQLRVLLSPDGWSELHVHGIIQSLRSFSLISSTSLSGIVHVRFHPLVHSWSVDMLSPVQTTDYRLMATQVVVSCTSPDDKELCRLLYQHVHKLMEHAVDSHLHVND